MDFKPGEYMSLEITIENMVAESIQASIAVKHLLLRDDVYQSKVSIVGHLMADALACGHKVVFFGNGGSAADAQHLAAELAGRYMVDRPALAGLTLTGNTSSLTA